MELTVTAPNRIDLAGGTTDLYPLYLLMDGGCTVNAAITIRSHVTFKTLAEPRVRIISEDLGASVEADGPHLLPTDGALGLVDRAVKACPPQFGLEITTRNEAPAGSGLGASSALLVALLSGLLRLRGEDARSETVIDLAANLETASIAVPAGKQDHIAALFGGLSVIEFGYRGFVREACCQDPDDLTRLEEMIVLSYTGQGRFSGMNNWEVTKAFIDNESSVREKLVQIRDVAKAAAAVTVSRNWAELPPLVDREWSIRRSLAPGITTPRIEEMMAAARSAGATASKICGAGGGGCMITLTDPRKRSKVETALSETGAQLLPFATDREGLTLTEGRTPPV